MAYDEGLAARVRGVLRDRTDVVEKKMFGGLVFMVGGHMTCGISGNQLMGRVGPARYREALAQEHASEMNFTGRSLKGFVYVSPEGVAEDEALAGWVRWCVDHSESLPPKSRG